jgi:FKBP-type peptidyl-prolyl cis-trans isomerase FklB
MKIKGLTLLAVAVAMIATSCTQSGIKSAKVKSTEDSLAYTFGIANYFYYQKDSIKIDPVLFAKGMIDAKAGKNTVDESKAQAFIMKYMQKKQQEQMHKMYGKNIDASEKFLAENKKREGVKETESGLQYEVIKMGNGPKPTASQKVRINYTGTLIDGKKFDSSFDHEGGKPADMDLNRVIPGMKEAMLLMPVGSKFKFYIPYELAYGEHGGGQIEPYSTLIFEVELLEILDK